ncbi:MAG: histidinol-phosphate transaminase [Spirochaetales bacterium]|nr:histidinol-phosphate transaminase [Spirochaetales bacterium]
MKLKTNLEQMIPYKPGILKEGAIKLSSNENRLGPSPMAIQAASEALADVHIYPDGSCRKLRESLADRHGISAESFIVGNGSDEIMTLIAAAYIGADDNAITAESTFSEYTFATILYAGEIRKAPLNEGTFDPEAILQRIDDRTKVIYFCNPNNPTGTYVSHERLDSMLSRIPHDVLFVLDEAYADYSDADDFPQWKTLLKKFPNLIILRTFSKIYGLAAMRIGYAMAKEEVINQILVTKQPFNVNTPGQRAAEAALKDSEFYEKSRAMNREGKKYLYRELERLGLKFYPTQANFICIHVKRDSSELFQNMMGRGVTIRPLASFGLNEWIRVTIGQEEDNKLLIRILEESLKC